MSPLRYQKWLRLNEVRRPMLNEHYDVTTAAYAVGYYCPGMGSKLSQPLSPGVACAVVRHSQTNR
ncbi:hypothetical protein AMK95_14040 [Escherichia coli]|nr:AraC family transcriptional regulator [Escherichia coli O121:H19]AWJ26794.1 AraC family transcriptional regulator [Escherichia coli O121 str. RM8352]KDV50035.1 transcriptional regulator [Escherichia coli O121:H19 str. 2011C-3609]KNG00771.1 hypothetical protein WQ80_14480 [Escherichia coli]KYW30423.1 hypothetical protein AMK95_14040 [Escherichia coli]